MTEIRTLVVADSHADTEDLVTALDGDGFSVRLVGPADLPAGPELSDGTDLVLLSASLGLQRIALLSRRMATGGDGPAVLVFPQDEMEALEACVRGGFEFVTPPFRPSLVRSRMSSALERGHLVGAVEEMATEASLLGYERELDTAREIQTGFLPDVLPSAPGWDLAGRLRSARHVSGDFYDGFELVDGHRFGLVIADVCDKGVSAALFVALIRTLVRHTAEQTGSWDLVDEVPSLVEADGETAPAARPTPPRLSLGAGPLLQSVISTNRYLTRNHLRQGYFATLVFGVLDPETGGVLYVNGGHNPPVLLRADGGHTLLEPTGPAIGMMPDSAYSLGYAALDPGDVLFLYTDGVVEAQSGTGAFFSMERLIQVLEQADGSAEDRIDAVEAAVAEHVGTAEQSDDLTMLVLRREA